MYCRHTIRGRLTHMRVRTLQCDDNGREDSLEINPSLGDAMRFEESRSMSQCRMAYMIPFWVDIVQ